MNIEQQTNSQNQTDNQNQPNTLTQQALDEQQRRRREDLQEKVNKLRKKLLNKVERVSEEDLHEGYEIYSQIQILTDKIPDDFEKFKAKHNFTKDFLLKSVIAHFRALSIKRQIITSGETRKEMQDLIYQMSTGITAQSPRIAQEVLKQKKLYQERKEKIREYRKDMESFYKQVQADDYQLDESGRYIQTVIRSPIEALYIKWPQMAQSFLDSVQITVFADNEKDGYWQVGGGYTLSTFTKGLNQKTNINFKVKAYWGYMSNWMNIVQQSKTKLTYHVTFQFKRQLSQQDFEAIKRRMRITYTSFSLEQCKSYMVLIDKIRRQNFKVEQLKVKFRRKKISKLKNADDKLINKLSKIFT